MQRLSDGPLLARLPQGSELWLDGAHNPNAAQPVARALRTLAQGRPVTLILGMLANKDAEAVVRILSPSINHVVAIPVPGHAHHAPETLESIARTFGIFAETATSPADALTRIAGKTEEPQLVLIAGSLYLAGEVLAANDQLPD
jgi:dihydrofolate synthase/folylpolyglutamate synthase